jgi:ribose 1,5-bisphosphokinase PhnN
MPGEARVLTITRDDGLITRDTAAELCGVDPVTISQWVSRGYVVVVNGVKSRRHLPVAKREGRTLLLDPVEVAKADHATKYRARRAVPRPGLAAA